MSVISGGEDVNAIVVDVGSGTTRAGYAGEELPRAVFPTLVGIIDKDENGLVNSSAKANGLNKNFSENKSSEYIGYVNLNIRRDNMDVISPYAQNSTYEDLDLLQKIFNYAFYDRMQLQLENHPMLICEPTNYLNSKSREDLISMVFETYDTPAVFLAKNAVLSSFATGRSSSLVIDMGYSGTTISGVHDGYLLHRSVIWSPIGGSCMTDCLKATIDPNGDILKPRYSFRRVEDSKGNLKTEYLEFPKTKKSFRDMCINTIASEVKEAVCRISDSTFIEDEDSNIPTVSYELPDGTEIHVGADRFKVPEILFQPELLTSFKGMDALMMEDGMPVKSVSDLVIDSINKCDVDIRKELYGGVVLTGGSSLFIQMRDRIEKEIAASSHYVTKVKVITPANSSERKYGAFIGGSILSSLATFQQMWMSRDEYKEHGPSLIQRRSP